MDDGRLDRVAEHLIELRHAVARAGESSFPREIELDPNERESARNLLHYLALRRQDLRGLQRDLAELGLSSLGRIESHVLASIDAVLDAVDRARGFDRPVRPIEADWERELLDGRVEALLGPPPAGRRARILVTLPSDAASEPELLLTMAEAGMDAARINCAHDDEDAWSAMIRHVRAADRVTGRRTRIVMDLGGPKLRTGALEPDPAVVKARPRRDALGVVLEPALVRFGDGGVPVDPVWLQGLAPGDRILLTDTRGAGRELVVVSVDELGVAASTGRTTYLAPGVMLSHESAGDTVVLPFEGREGALLLRPGDPLALTRDQAPGGRRADGVAEIPCTLPEAFEAARVGDRIWLDDGRVGGVIQEIDADRVVVAITTASSKGSRLRAEKGINLPDTVLDVPALTREDEHHLAFVATYADAVALSFVQRPDDVRRAQELAAKLGRPELGIVLKIETHTAFEQLPKLLLEAMAGPGTIGVMIARGDLGVELGWERLAEVQEEILWLCEAAHVPVIWATQVLEGLAKRGVPSRAEVTDAAMGARADCVMLNKGPSVVEAIRALDDILRRMQEHQHKKTALLRRLRAWDDLEAGNATRALTTTRDGGP